MAVFPVGQGTATSIGGPLLPAGKDHLDATKTAYYTASTYTQPSGFKDLGTYEVWLSNHIGRNQRLEPTANSGVINCPDGTRSDVYGGTCPSDDLQEYLDYAAYGMFVFMPDAAVGAAIPTDRGRIPINALRLRGIQR